MARFDSAADGVAAIRYAGVSEPTQTNIHLHGDKYQSLWIVPWAAKTGRYEIDFTTSGGKSTKNIGSFAVHRQLAKVVAFELDKTFYTSGDSVNPRIVVQNISDQPINHLQVEFEGYTYPWIAPAADEDPAWKTVADNSLSLAPGATKEFRLKDAARVQATDGQTNIYFSAVIRDSEKPDHIYDLAFALPAITAPLKNINSKAYPTLYLYPTLKKLPASESYRNFFPAAYVSDVIAFDTKHTMFPTRAPSTFSFTISARDQTGFAHSHLEYLVLDRNSKTVNQGTLSGAISGTHQIQVPLLVAGRYTLEVSVQAGQGLKLASNRLDFAVNELPKSILLFCAHEDDDTAHPEMIRASVENNIPIHVVYFTGGDAGGCDRYYMHSCDASRAMDFGEARMDESRASLDHLGVPSENIFFLGLPDGGMEQIWARNPDSAHPYLSVLLASEHSPYRNSAVPNLTYARDAVIEATKGFIEKYKPDMIITGHPDERHVDHRTNNWIVVKAMQELLKRGSLSPGTQLIVDGSYGPGPQKHAPYKYEKVQFYTSGNAAILSQEASWYYQTQDGNREQSEIMTYNKLQRDAPAPHFGIYIWPYPHYRILDWQKHEGWNE